MRNVHLVRFVITAIDLTLSLIFVNYALLGSLIRDVLSVVELRLIYYTV